MIAGVVNCPQPPLLLPGSTGCPVAEVEQLRAACLAALRDLLATRPESVVLIGGIAAAEAGRDSEPISLQLGRQLLAEAGCTLPTRRVGVRQDATTEECLATGRRLATDAADRSLATDADARPLATDADARRLATDAAEPAPGRPIALVVMADGSARRGLKAPGYLDARAQPFDDTVTAALTAGDPAGLAELDAGLAADLLVAGRAAWQLLAGATEGRRFQAETYYLGDPFGVWYPVVRWH